MNDIVKDDKELKRSFNNLPSFDLVLEQLVKERKDAGLSIRGMAQLAGLQKTQVERIEAGTNNKAELYEKYASALGRKITYNLE